MTVLRFRALALSPEIPLSAIAETLGLRRRFAWEDPLELAGDTLRRLWPDAGDEQVFLFAFGAVVFVESNEPGIRNVLDALGRLHPSLKQPQPFRWSDHYRLVVDSEEPPTCDNDGITVPVAGNKSVVVLATILAKSVALERVEAALEAALDQSEKRIESLERGSLRSAGADATMARDAGAVLRLEYESIHYLGLPDKPECTWDDDNAERLYTQLERQFELRERYAAVRHRVDVLKDLNGTFANLAHAKRSARLEWIIILLIAFEIVLPAARWLWQWAIGG